MGDESPILGKCTSEHQIWKPMQGRVTARPRSRECTLFFPVLAHTTVTLAIGFVRHVFRHLLHDTTLASSGSRLIAIGSLPHTVVGIYGQT